jgi:dTDP-4-amino-4,6-dideoxygalactose transaminase
VGATPVFCEVDPKTLLADPKDVEKRITARTRVVSPIHFGGRVCDMDGLLGVCNRHKVVLVEDAAHAHGSEWGGVKIGNLGHIACFSLQGLCPGGKPVSAGEGGIVATNDRELYERALIHCHLHRSGAVEELTNPVYKQLEPQLLGWKWRAHPLALAVARVSFKSLPHRLERFAATRDELADGIRGLPGVEFAHNYPKAKGVEIYGGLHLLYDPAALGGLPLDKLCKALSAEGVPAGAHAYRAPEHLRSIYTKDFPGLWGKGHPGPGNVPLPRYRQGDYPVTEGLFGRVMTLPGWIEPADGLISQIALALRKVVENHRKLL